MNELTPQLVDHQAAEQASRANTESVPARIAKLTDQVIQRALAVPSEHRQNGPHYGSPGIMVGDSSETQSIEAIDYPVKSRIHVAPSSVKLESFETGQRKNDAMASTSTTIFKNSDGQARGVHGNVTERTPYGSHSHPSTHKESVGNAIKTLKHIRGHVVQAEARHRAASKAETE